MNRPPILSIEPPQDDSTCTLAAADARAVWAYVEWLERDVAAVASPRAPAAGGGRTRRDTIPVLRGRLTDVCGRLACEGDCPREDYPCAVEDESGRLPPSDVRFARCIACWMSHLQGKDSEV